jgi:hypothetical protein
VIVYATAIAYAIITARAIIGPHATAAPHDSWRHHNLSPLRRSRLSGGKTAWRSMESAWYANRTCRNDLRCHSNDTSRHY